MIKIIMVHGKTHSGKGVFSSFLKATLKKNTNTNIIHCSLSTYIRNLVKEFFYEGDMDSPECRDFMAKVYEYGSKLYPYHKSRRVWEYDILPYINNSVDNIVIIESFREKNDIRYFETLQQKGYINNITTIKIERPNFEMKNYINANHKSENDLNDYGFNYTIVNDGDLNGLEDKAIEFAIDNELMDKDHEFSVGNRIKVAKVNNDLEHMDKYKDLEGYIISWYPVIDNIKYHVVFDDNRIKPCGFYANELELI